MKILQVINGLETGGAEKLLVDTCRIYKQRGLEVDVLLLKGTRTDLYKKLEKIKGIEIYDLGVENDKYSLLNIFRIRKYLRGYDIVHVHLFPSSYFVGFAKILSRSSAKFIFTEHSTLNRRRDSKLFKPLEYLIYRRYDAIVSISKSVHNNLVKHLDKINLPITLIENGIDLEEINKAEPYSKLELGFEKSEILLIQVSNFLYKKDQKTAIKAMASLADNVNLLLVGTGPMQKECKNLADQMNIARRIHFLGYRGDVPKLLKSVDLVLLSSHAEGLSLASVEGMASSKPFIASDVPGLNDVVKGAGVLFEDNNAQELSNVIKKLLEDSVFYNETVTDCMLRSKSYDINRMVSDYIDLYKTT